MTPLIREMVALTVDIDYPKIAPEEMMWFDAGRLSPTEAIRVPADLMMNLPFPKTAITTIATDGVKVALWLIGGDGSVTVGGVTKHNYVAPGAHGGFGKVLSPFTYFATPEGMRYISKGEEVTAEDVKAGFRIVVACLMKIQSESSAYQPTVPNTFINKKRLKKGKLPLFDWHTVTIERSSAQRAPAGGTHASPRLHDRRGHWRKHPSGRQVWVKPCKVGDARLGVVFKDYVVQEVKP